MRHVLNFTVTVDAEKLGNVPEMLRLMSDRYEGDIKDGKQRDVITTAIVVALPSQPETKLNCRMVVSEEFLPDIPALLP